MARFLLGFFKNLKMYLFQLYAMYTLQRPATDKLSLQTESTIVCQGETRAGVIQFKSAVHPRAVIVLCENQSRY